MNQEEWDRRKAQIVKKYGNIGPLRAVERSGVEPPGLRFLHYTLAYFALFAKTAASADFSTDETMKAWSDTIDLEVLQESTRIQKLIARHQAGEDVSLACWELCAEAHAGRLAFAAGLIPPALVVDDALQYQLLTLEPPMHITEDDVVLPAEGFTLSIPHRAFGAAWGTWATALGTHAFIGRSFPMSNTAEKELALIFVCPYRKSARVHYRIGPVYGTRDVEEHPGAVLLRRYILNLLLFLGSDEAVLQSTHADEIARIEAIPKKKRRKVLDERLKRLKEDKTLVLSTTCTINPEIKQFVLEGGLQSPTYTLKHRTLVRGHWRNQVCGEGRKDRKRIAIQAHFRGPTLEEQMGAAVVHTYNVKAPKTPPVT